MGFDFDLGDGVDYSDYLVDEDQPGIEEQEQNPLDVAGLGPEFIAQTSSPGELKELVVASLKAQMRTTHPDRNPGDLADYDARLDIYHEAGAAMEELSTDVSVLVQLRKEYLKTHAYLEEGHQLLRDTLTQTGDMNYRAKNFVKFVDQILQNPDSLFHATNLRFRLEDVDQRVEKLTELLKASGQGRDRQERELTEEFRKGNRQVADWEKRVEENAKQICRQILTAELRLVSFRWEHPEAWKEHLESDVVRTHVKEALNFIDESRREAKPPKEGADRSHGPPERCLHEVSGLLLQKEYALAEWRAEYPAPYAEWLNTLPHDPILGSKLKWYEGVEIESSEPIQEELIEVALIQLQSKDPGLWWKYVESEAFPWKEIKHLVEGVSDEELQKFADTELAYVTATTHYCYSWYPILTEGDFAEQLREERPREIAISKFTSDLKIGIIRTYGDDIAVSERKQHVNRLHEIEKQLDLNDNGYRELERLEDQALCETVESTEERLFDVILDSSGAVSFEYPDGRVEQRDDLRILGVFPVPAYSSPGLTTAESATNLLGKGRDKAMEAELSELEGVNYDVMRSSLGRMEPQPPSVDEIRSSARNQRYFLVALRSVPGRSNPEFQFVGEINWHGGIDDEVQWRSLGTGESTKGLLPEESLAQHDDVETDFRGKNI